MPAKCSVPLCTSNYRQNRRETVASASISGYVSVFSFPKDEVMKQKWIEAIQRESFTPTKHSVVCIKHFSESFITRVDVMPRRDGSILKVPRKVPKLSEDAVPSIFPNHPPDLSKKPPPKRKHPNEKRQDLGSETPGSVERESPVDLEQSLMSMEILDRSSPELWPERRPDVADFLNNFAPPITAKLPYSRELGAEDQKYLKKLSRLSVNELVAKVKELHDIAYQLGVEESKEMTRGKHLNIFNKRKRK